MTIICNSRLGCSLLEAELKMSYPADGYVLKRTYQFPLDVKLFSTKARLVTHGFHQEYGVDYNETIARVLKFSYLRLILTLVAAEDLELHQMDVKIAFVHAELDKEISMDPPET